MKNIYITDELHAKIKTACKKEGMLLNAFAERAIELELGRLYVRGKTTEGKGDKYGK